MILQHLNASDVEQLRRVNRTLRSIVAAIGPGQQLIWRPRRMLQIPMPDYMNVQARTRNAIAYQSDIETVRDLTTEAFKAGNLKITRYHVTTSRHYFPDVGIIPIEELPLGDIFMYIAAIVRDSENEKWVVYPPPIMHRLTEIGSVHEIYELCHWAIVTKQRHFAPQAGLSGIITTPMAHDIEHRQLYRAEVYKLLLDRRFITAEILLDLINTATPLNRDLMKLTFLEMVENPGIKEDVVGPLQEGNHHEAAVRALLSVMTDTAMLRWVYYHYRYSIPNPPALHLSPITHNRMLYLSPLVEYLVIQRHVYHPYQDDILMEKLMELVAIDRSCLWPAAYILANAGALSIFPKELPVLCAFNDIDIQKELEKMAPRHITTRENGVAMLKVLKCGDNVKGKRDHLDMLANVRLFPHGSLLPRIQMQTDYRVVVIYDKVDQLTDMLPRMGAEARKEAADLAVQMSSLKVAAFLRDEYGIMPDDIILEWLCRYGTVDAMKFINATMEEEHLAAAIEAGHVDMVLYLRDELNVPMPAEPHVTTVRMSETLGIVPDLMELCREGNMDLLEERTPDPALFLPVVEIGNGIVVEWFLEKLQNLPIGEAIAIAKRNKMWHLHRWLSTVMTP